jgi:hypothetical protein
VGVISHLRRDLHVFEIAGLVVDADARRRDPAGELAGLDHALHQAGDEIAVVLRRQPLARVALPGRLVDELAGRRHFHVLELADQAVKADMGQFEFERDAGLVDDLVPAVDTALAVGGVVVAQPHIDRGQCRLVDPLDLAVDKFQHRIGRALEPVVVVDLGFLEAALEPRRKRVGGVGRNLRAEQVERQRVMQIELFLDGRQVDDAEVADFADIVRVLDPGRLHRLAGALDGAADAGLADEHVVRLFGQHEAAGARQRIEAGLREALQLHLAVAVGEECEHVERQPVRRRFVEGAEHARLVGVAGAAF